MVHVKNDSVNTGAFYTLFQMLIILPKEQSLAYRWLIRKVTLCYMRYKYSAQRSTFYLRCVS